MANIIGQERIQSALAQALASGRLAQSYLIYGAYGTGKRAATLAFAQGLLCEKRGRHKEREIACGKCLACTKVDRGLHPDLHVYMPHFKDTSTDELRERLHILFRNPYEPIDFVRRPVLEGTGKKKSGAVIFQADRIREIMREMHFSPVEGVQSIGVFLDIDRMKDASANYLLKLLEEPPEQTVLILTTERMDQLLPTVLSRCQLLRLDPLPSGDIEEALVDQKSVEPLRASYVARMADGSYSRALELLENESLAAQRELALEFIRQSYTLKAEELLDVLTQANSAGRESVKQLFSLMLTWIRDLVLYKSTGDSSALVNVDQARAIEDFVAGVPNANLNQMALFIEEAAELLERNVHTNLTLMSLAHALSDAMHGRPRSRLVESLDLPREFAA